MELLEHSRKAKLLTQEFIFLLNEGLSNSFAMLSCAHTGQCWKLVEANHSVQIHEDFVMIDPAGVTMQTNNPWLKPTKMNRNFRQRRQKKEVTRQQRTEMHLKMAFKETQMDLQLIRIKGILIDPH